MLLFKDLMESVLWWKKGEMKKTVHRAIIPLLFRMSDNTESVAKVQISDLATDVGTGCADTRGVFWAWRGQGSRQSDTLGMCVRCHLPASASPQASAEVLLACAKFLKWKQLEQLAQTEDIWKIGEYLVRRTTQPQAPYEQACLTCPGCSSPESPACSCIVAPFPPAQSPKGSSAGPSAFPTPSMREETLAHLGLGSGTERSPNSFQTSAPQSSWLGAGDGLGERGRGVLAGGSCPAGWGASVSSVPLCFLQLKQKRSRVEGYLQQSLTYLEDDQTSLRKTAVKFVGKPRPCFPVWALPWQ